MRKVGIITIFNLNNYGNRLQAYALSKVIEKLNCKVSQVRYCGNDIKLMLKEFIKKNRVLLNLFYFCEGILKGKKLTQAIKNCKRFDLFAVFSKKFKSEIMFSEQRFDYYICGSDQIWNPYFGELRYFAPFAAKEKRISYAASFGVSELPEEAEVKYKEYLTDMQHISVREQSGAEIVKKLTGKEALVLPDPTLMIDKDEWKAVSKKPKFNVENKYILTYFLDRISEETDAYIKRIAEENDLKIISLHRFEENDYWYHTGPAEFIWLIENASLVCTDSFHGSVFSVVMESPFIVFKRNGEGNDMHSRIETLLSTLRLQDRFSECIKEGEEFKKDYEHIPEILNSEREKAYKFLKGSMGIDEND